LLQHASVIQGMERCNDTYWQLDTEEYPDAPSDFWQHQNKEGDHILNKTEQMICTLLANQEGSNI